MLPIKAGVPQESAHGPTLFNVYINDLPEPIDHRTTYTLYADDTANITKSTNARLIPTIIQTELRQIDTLQQLVIEGQREQDGRHLFYEKL